MILFLSALSSLDNSSSTKPWPQKRQVLVAIGFGRQELHDGSEGLLPSIFLDMELSRLNKTTDRLESWGDVPIDRLVAALPGARFDVVRHVLLEKMVKFKNGLGDHRPSEETVLDNIFNFDDISDML